MTITIIDAFPEAPLRRDPEFAEKAEIFVDAWQPRVDQMNAVAIEINDARQVAETSASIALASSNAAQASAAFKGNWSSLTGSITRPSSVYHNGKFWLLLPASLANVTLSQPGVSADWLEFGTKLLFFTYENRNNVRSMTPNNGDQIVIEGLGLFVWKNVTDEVDDDETCFATTSGRWLLQGISLDVLFSFNNLLKEEINDNTDLKIFEAENELKTYVSDRYTRIYTLKKDPAIASVSANTSVNFTCNIVGAKVGDAVSISPTLLPYNLSTFGIVTATDVVTVYINNHTASSGSIPAGLWSVAVIGVK